MGPKLENVLAGERNKRAGFSIHMISRMLAETLSIKLVKSLQTLLTRPLQTLIKLQKTESIK